MLQCFVELHVLLHDILLRIRARGMAALTFPTRFLLGRNVLARLQQAGQCVFKRLGSV